VYARVSNKITLLVFIKVILASNISDLCNWRKSIFILEENIVRFYIYKKNVVFSVSLEEIHPNSIANIELFLFSLCY